MHPVVALWRAVCAWCALYPVTSIMVQWYFLTVVLWWSGAVVQVGLRISYLLVVAPFFR